MSMQTTLEDRLDLDRLDQVLALSRLTAIRTRAESSDRRHSELIGEIRADPETQTARSYGFKCPSCKYDWTSWLKPSITFVSLSFVTDDCPNCQREYVQASMFDQKGALIVARRTEAASSVLADVQTAAG
jgi:hypothetical protein